MKQLALLYIGAGIIAALFFLGWAGIHAALEAAK